MVATCMSPGYSRDDLPNCSLYMHRGQYQHFSSTFNLKDTDSTSRRPHKLAAQNMPALLMVGTISGILLAMLMNNSGGAWDNAKSSFKGGRRRRSGHTRLQLSAIRSAILQDTAGPSLHVLIKLLATVTQCSSLFV